MKRKFLLSGVLAAALLFTAAYAAAQSDLLRHFFTGDTSAFDADIQTEAISGRLGDYQVTVLEALNDDHFAYLTVSFEALSDAAQAVLDNDDQLADVVHLDIEGADDPASYSLTELPEQRTPTADCYAITVSGFQNPAQKPLRLRLAGQDGCLEIPMTQKLEAVVLEPRQTVTGYDFTTETDELRDLSALACAVTVDRISLSPFGVYLTYTPEDPSQQPLPRGFLFFEKKDGTVCTEEYFSRGASSHSCSKEEGGRMDFQFRTLEDFSSIQAVVLNGTAYPLDGGDPYPVTVDRHLYPFLSSCVYREAFRSTASGARWLPIRTLCGALGADYRWDESQKRCTIVYRGETFTLSPGENVFQVPGIPEPVTVSAELLNGEFLTDSRFSSVLRIQTGGADASRERIAVIP